MELTKKQKMDLSMLAIKLDLPVWQAIQANVVMWGALDIFAKDPEHAVFERHPANTFVYTALHALEDRCVVEIAEALKDEGRLLPPGMTIRGKSELVNHRDAVSHTWTIKWRRPAMQTFFEAHRQWTDIRVAIIWDMWRSFNDGLVVLGEPAKQTTVTVGPIHATMYHTILRYSMKPEALATLPSEEDLLAYLNKVAADLFDFIVTRPGG